MIGAERKFTQETNWGFFGTIIPENKTNVQLIIIYNN